MADEPDYIVDIQGEHLEGPRCGEQPFLAGISVGRARNRPFISVHFSCCQIYQRVYRNGDGSAYEGRCPKCLRRVHVRIGPEGSSDRFFTAE